MVYTFKKVKLPNTLYEIKEHKNTKEENSIIEIIPEENENQKKEEQNKSKKKTSLNQPKGLSQREINIFEQQQKKSKKHRKELALLAISSLIDFLSNFTYLVSYAHVINYSESNNDNKNSNHTIYNSSFNVSSDSDNSNNKKDNSQSSLIPFRICSRIIFMYTISIIFFYYDKPHRHHVISLLFIIIIVISVYFIEIILTNLEITIIIRYYIISFIQEFLFCLDNVIGAKYLSISNGNVYQLLFYNGLFGILMIIIITFTSKYMHCSELHLNQDYCNSDNLKYFTDFKFWNPKLILLISSLIISIIEMACTWLLIFYQTVNHLSVACAIHLILRYIMEKDVKTTLHIILGIISLFPMSFFALVFNEIIVLKFCNLDKNTFEEIERRCIEDQYLVERNSLDPSSDNLNFDDSIN